MATPQRPSRLLSRKSPYGEITGILGDDVYFSNGATASIDEICGHDFMSRCPTGYHMLCDLIGETVVLRKLLVDATRRFRPTITDFGGFNREIHSVAGKIEEHPDDVRAIIGPILEKLLHEMLTKPKPPMTGTERGKSDRRRHLTGEGDFSGWTS
jgi:hypothetical protein